MASSTPSSNAPSRIPTPSPHSNPQNTRFTSQAATAEDLLKSQTVGLVHLSDFRKRRAEALEQKEREAHQRGGYGRFTSASTSGAATPSDGVSTPAPPKKKRRPVTKGKLSFGVDDEEDGEDGSRALTPATQTPRSSTPEASLSEALSPSSQPSDGSSRKRLGPNSHLNVMPKAMTKAALLREAQTREQLRKEFLLMQDAVKASEILIPFVFYDGTSTPGGACKVKKGDYVWLFLDRSRKVGAELGVGGRERGSGRRDWARVGVDDLMLVRGEVIIPHHYELYYFIVNKTLGPTNIPLFDYTSCLPPPLSRSPSPSHDTSTPPPPLEGASADPKFTKVVDRRWYERNKHIFPASVWEEFDPGRDYSKGKRSDSKGNAFFFS